MRIAVIVLSFACATARLSAQNDILQGVNFEFQPACVPFPSPCGNLGDPEGVSWNGLGGAFPAGPNGCGMPCSGNHFARVIAHGPLNVPLCGGAGAVRPLPPGTAAELCIAIPCATASVGFCWDFYNAEGPDHAARNDGMSVDIVDGAGNLIQSLVYADTSSACSPLGPCMDTAGICTFSGGREVLPAGANVFGPVAVPPLPVGARLSVVCWNGGDDTVSSHAAIDNITFLIAPPTLTVASPGPNQILMNAFGFTPGNLYVTAVTLNQGAFPSGWFFGVDIPFGMLAEEMFFGPPFFGVFDACGATSFFRYGLASATTIYAVTLELDVSTGLPANWTLPITFTEP